MFNFLSRKARKAYYLADHGESSDPLSVESHVLGVRLGQADAVAVVQELPDRERVSVHVARGESLVGHVEEDKEVPALDDLRELLPLLGPRVHPGRVVGAGVEKDDAPLGDFLEGRLFSTLKQPSLLMALPTLMSSQAPAKSNPQVPAS